MRFDWGAPDTLQIIKTLPYYFPTEVEFDGDGNLWLWVCGNGYDGGELHLVDQETGDLQFVGASDTAFDDLAWNPVDQQMYAVSPFLSLATTSSQLYTIDLQTGQSALVGDVEDDGPNPLNWMSGLGIASDNSFYYYNNAADTENDEQGIWKSGAANDPLEVQLLHHLASVLGEPNSAFQIGPVFVDWSRDDLGYASQRYQPTGATTHTMQYTFDDDGIYNATKVGLEYGILWSITRAPADK